MIWFAAALFAIVGIVMIVRRGEIARGQSMLWGGNTPAGCVIVQGLFFILIGIAFVAVWKMGLLGGN